MFTVLVIYCYVVKSSKENHFIISPDVTGQKFWQVLAGWFFCSRWHWRTSLGDIQLSGGSGGSTAARLSCGLTEMLERLIWLCPHRFPHTVSVTGSVRGVRYLMASKKEGSEVDDLGLGSETGTVSLQLLFYSLQQLQSPPTFKGKAIDFYSHWKE